MKSYSILPEGYGELCTLHLQKNKKTALFVNGLAIVIAVLMFLIAHYFIPVSTIFTLREDPLGLVVKLGVFAVIDIAYLFLHELIHGAAMKFCGTKRVKYGFTGLYAFAGSEDYYNKKAYFFIALAPVVLWGIVLGVVSFFVPTGWFWVVYGVQIINISGAAGDYYVTAKFLRFPSCILIRDSGTSMTVYSPKEAD